MSDIDLGPSDPSWMAVLATQWDDLVRSLEDARTENEALRVALADAQHGRDRTGAFLAGCTRRLREETSARDAMRVVLERLLAEWEEDRLRAPSSVSMGMARAALGELPR